MWIVFARAHLFFLGAALAAYMSKAGGHSGWYLALLSLWGGVALLGSIEIIAHHRAAKS